MVNKISSPVTLPICGKCQGSLVLESDINGNNNIWFVCKNCDLHHLVFMNLGYTISKVEGFIPPPEYSVDNPLCSCGHTLTKHFHPNENTACVLCDCIVFVSI